MLTENRTKFLDITNEFNIFFLILFLQPNLNCSSKQFIKQYYVDYKDLWGIHADVTHIGTVSNIKNKQPQSAGLIVRNENKK